MPVADDSPTLFLEEDVGSSSVISERLLPILYRAVVLTVRLLLSSSGSPQGDDSNPLFLRGVCLDDIANLLSLAKNGR